MENESMTKRSKNEKSSNTKWSTPIRQSPTCIRDEQYFNTAIDNIKQNRRVSGKKLVNTKLPIELQGKYSTNDVLIVAYLEAKELSDIPICEICHEQKVPFISTIKGFKKYCPNCGRDKVQKRFVADGAKHSRNYAAKKKENIRSELQRAIDHYITNHVTIKETARLYDLKPGTLRSELVCRKLVKQNNAKQFISSNFRKQVDDRLFDSFYLLTRNEAGDTLEDVAEELGVSKNTVRVYALKHNIVFKNYGKIEREILNFVRKFDPNSHKSRSIISPYEIDIYSPEFDFGIELNGEYWHSSDKKDKNYHINKQILAENKDIRLIQIYLHEWTNKRAIIESMIRSVFGKTERIYARKCRVEKLDKSTARLFFNENHLHGSVGSQVAYGLYYNDILVSAASFGKSRYDRRADVELLRYCNRLNMTVVGGFGKLMKKFLEENETENVITYSHRRLFNGDCYTKVGFTLLHETTPGYFWYKNGSVVSRYRTQKHKLNTTLTENEYMRQNGYTKVYDCGQRVFILNK